MIDEYYSNDCKYFSAQDFLDEKRWIWKQNRMRKSEFSHDNMLSEIKSIFSECDMFCNNRLIIGNFRYPGGHTTAIDRYNLIDAARNRIERYQTAKDIEALIDAINMLRLQFIGLRAKGIPFVSIDDGEHSVKK